MSLFHPRERGIVLARIEARKIKCVQIEDSIEDERERKKAEVDELNEAAQKKIAPLLQQIQEIEKKLYEQASEVAAKSDALIQEWNDQVRGLQRLNDKDHHLISPMYSIPEEILGLIFESYVSDDTSPRILQAISRRWRRVSLSTPCLWTRIRIYSSQSKPRIYPSREPLMTQRHWGTGFEPCSTIEEVNRMGKMAGNLDLQVHIYSVEVENDPNKVPEVLSTILGPQFCARIVDLRIETIDYRSTSTEWIGNFPKLRSLQFSYLREGSLQSLIATRSMVRTLTLYYDCAVSALPDSTWSGLRSLKVERMSAENVHQLLPKLAQIEHLTGLPMSWPNKNTPPFTLPYLEEISLSCDPAWIHILTMPKLKKLHLIQEKPRRSDAQSDNQGRDKSSKDLSFPDLEYLDVTTNSPSFLSKYHLPSLRSIRLSSESFDFHKRHRLLPFKCSNTLSELILEGGCSTDVILDALRKASLLRVFKLEKYRAKDHVGLIDVLAITDKPHVICPRLEQVSLSFRYSGDFNIAEQDPAPYQKVKDARQCAGLPFYVFDLNYRETYRTLHRRL